MMLSRSCARRKTYRLQHDEPIVRADRVTTDCSQNCNRCARQRINNLRFRRWDHPARGDRQRDHGSRRCPKPTAMVRAVDAEPRSSVWSSSAQKVGLRVPLEHCRAITVPRGRSINPRGRVQLALRWPAALVRMTALERRKWALNTCATGRRALHTS